jgi:hypothetical protein
VIWESREWKEPLLAMARRLDSARYAKRLTARRLAQVERDIFLGCFSVRKLMHSGPKLTDACRAMRLPVTWYRNVQRVDSLNWHRIDKLYDLAKGHGESRDLEFLCGRFIHSFVFVPEEGADGGLAGFYFASDLDRNARLYRIAVEEIVRAFETVGRDYPANVSGTRDAASGEWIFKAD